MGFLPESFSNISADLSKRDLNSSLEIIEKAKKSGVQFRTLAEYAEECRPDKCEIIMGTLTGRAGTLAVQKEE